MGDHGLFARDAAFCFGRFNDGIGIHDRVRI